MCKFPPEVCWLPPHLPSACLWHKGPGLPVLLALTSQLICQRKPSAPGHTNGIDSGRQRFWHVATCRGSIWLNHILCISIAQLWQNWPFDLGGDITNLW